MNEHDREFSRKPRRTLTPISRPTADPEFTSPEYTGAYCLDQGDQAFIRGDQKLALRWYTRAMDKDPGMIEPWLAMLRVLILKGDLDESATWIHRGLILFPENPRLLALSNVQLAQRKMKSKALADSADLLDRNPNVPMARLCRGEVLLACGERHFDRLFRETLDLSKPDDWKTPLIVGMILLNAGRLRLTVEYLDEASRRNSQCAPIWFLLGQVYAAQGNRRMMHRALDQGRTLCDESDPLIARIDSVQCAPLWKRLTMFFK